MLWRGSSVAKSTVGYAGGHLGKTGSLSLVHGQSGGSRSFLRIGASEFESGQRDRTPGGQIEQCGWLKDRYGLSWQIVPAVMDEMMKTKDPKRLARVTQAFLKMKKFDIAALQRAYEG